MVVFFSLFYSCWSVAEMNDKSNAKAFYLTFDVCVEAYREWGDSSFHVNKNKNIRKILSGECVLWNGCV